MSKMAGYLQSKDEVRAQRAASGGVSAHYTHPNPNPKPVPRVRARKTQRIAIGIDNRRAPTVISTPDAMRLNRASEAEPPPLSRARPHPDPHPTPSLPTSSSFIPFHSLRPALFIFPASHLFPFLLSRFAFPLACPSPSPFPSHFSPFVPHPPIRPYPIRPPTIPPDSPRTRVPKLGSRLSLPHPHSPATRADWLRTSNSPSHG
ncbi:hypothetical protein DFH09DRAFT_71140 [Mycena vulgaris]|nr:hypothetical protein DFH09DRAFT_71140 [Mycena vulgaris]